MVAGRGLGEALLRLLRGRRRCIGLAEAAAVLRATPGEVRGVAEGLAERGLVVVEAGRVCLVGGGGAGGCSLGGFAARGGVLVASRGGVALVAVCVGGGGLGAVVRAARRAASAARRLVEEGSVAEAVPLVVSARYAGRLVEGVPVVSPREAEGLAADPVRAAGELAGRYGVLLRRYRRGMTT